MELTNYVSVEETIEAVEKAGFKWVAVRNLTSHPGDWHLKVVLAYRESNAEWVVWLYNATDKGLHEGYYTKNGEVARIKYQNKK
jgi:predicted methyltransferase